MSQIEVSYEDMKQKVADELRKHQKGYLATSEGKFVTVRRMGYVSDGLTIWCLTDKDSRKCNHIKANPNVAIAVGDNLQIEGVAYLKGHPLDEEHTDYIRAFQEHDMERYERSLRPGRILQRPGTRVIEVNPKRIVLNTGTLQWDLEPGPPVTVILDTENEKAHRVNTIDLYKAPAYRE
jgi:general stress protein 26